MIFKKNLAKIIFSLLFLLFTNVNADPTFELVNNTKKYSINFIMTSPIEISDKLEGYTHGWTPRKITKPGKTLIDIEGTIIIANKNTHKTRSSKFKIMFLGDMKNTKRIALIATDYLCDDDKVKMQLFYENNDSNTSTYEALGYIRDRELLEKNVENNNYSNYSYAVTNLFDDINNFINHLPTI